MKRKWRLTLCERNDSAARRNCIYVEAETEIEARDYYEKNFSRFNVLVQLKDVTAAH